MCKNPKFNSRDEAWDKEEEVEMREEEEKDIIKRKW